MFGDPRRTPADAAGAHRRTIARCCGRSTFARSASAAAACCASRATASPTPARAARTSPAALRMLRRSPRGWTARASSAPTPHDPPTTPCSLRVTACGSRQRPACAANVLGIVPRALSPAVTKRRRGRAFELLADRSAAMPLRWRGVPASMRPFELRAHGGSAHRGYAIDPQHAVLVGGGGGCGAILPACGDDEAAVPYRARCRGDRADRRGARARARRRRTHHCLPDAEEIARIRREAADRVVAAGASPDRIVVEVEIDAHRSRVTAIASGATELAEDAGARCSAGERRAIAAQSLGCEASQLESVELTAALDGYEQRAESGGFGARHSMRRLRVVDERGSCAPRSRITA